jgi:hypothetical protein
MQIFYSDEDPEIAAQNLDNRRLNKMIIESAQLLSTAYIVSAYPDAFSKMGKITDPLQYVWIRKKHNLYKPTHHNHPCAKWARESEENYIWLMSHFISLLEEFKYRFEKEHKTGRLLDDLADFTVIPPGPFTEPPAVVPDDIEAETTVDAYKILLCRKWTMGVASKWTKRKPPRFFLTYQHQVRNNNMTNEEKGLVPIKVIAYDVGLTPRQARIKLRSTVKGHKSKQRWAWPKSEVDGIKSILKGEK